MFFKTFPSDFLRLLPKVKRVAAALLCARRRTISTAKKSDIRPDFRWTPLFLSGMYDIIYTDKGSDEVGGTTTRGKAEIWQGRSVQRDAKSSRAKKKPSWRHHVGPLKDCRGSFLGVVAANYRSGLLSLSRRAICDATQVGAVAPSTRINSYTHIVDFARCCLFPDSSSTKCTRCLWFEYLAQPQWTLPSEWAPTVTNGL